LIKNFNSLVQKELERYNASTNQKSIKKWEHLPKKEVNLNRVKNKNKNKNKNNDSTYLY